MKNLTHIDEILSLKIVEFSNINFLNVEPYFSDIYIQHKNVKPIILVH
jgi:hypothetical protein